MRPLPFLDADGPLNPDRDSEWIAQHHTAPALVHVVDARRGLLDAKFEALARVAATLATTTAREST